MTAGGGGSQVWRARPARILAAVGAWLVLTTIWALVLHRYLFHGWVTSRHRFGDLFQRLAETRLLLRGHDPYFVGQHISDNVPPAVSLLHLPLTWVSPQTAAFIACWLSLASVAVIIAAAASTVVGCRRSVALVAASLVSLPICAVLVFPVTAALSTGQDQLWFLALVTVDLLWVPKRRAGFLVGLVASLSLWPAIFILAIAARSQLRGLLRALIGGVVGVLAGVAFAPAASWRYWTYLVPSGQVSSRGVNSSASWPVSGFAGTWNDSINGILTRPPLGGSLATRPAFLVAFVVLLAVTLLAAWGLWKLGLVMCPLLVLSIGAVEASPFAWQHHWVWVVLWLPFAGVEAYRAGHRAFGVILVLSTLVFFRQAYNHVGAYVTRSHGEVVITSTSGFLFVDAYQLVGLLVIASSLVVIMLGRRELRPAAPGG